MELPSEEEEDEAAATTMAKLAAEKEEEEEEEGEAMDYTESGYGIPVSHEVTMVHGNKPVSALTLDRSGTRLITGLNFCIEWYWSAVGVL